MGISCLLLSCVLVSQTGDPAGAAGAGDVDTPASVVVPEDGREPAPSTDVMGGSIVTDGATSDTPLYTGVPGANPGVADPVPETPAAQPDSTGGISTGNAAFDRAMNALKDVDVPPDSTGGVSTGNAAIDRAMNALKDVDVPPLRQQQTQQPTSNQTRRLTASELLADATTPRAGAELEGRDATLLELLGPVSDRAKRLRVAHAYWELVGQVAAYGVAIDEWELISRVQPDTATAAVAKATWESAEAAVAAARLNVTQSQYRLAEAVGMASGSPLPLPTDRPHIGAYQTRFDSLFSSYAAPSRLRLIDRTLPIRASVIAIRLQAVHAAEDALNATGAAYNELQPGVALPNVYTAIREYSHQRRMLFASVRRYNDDIADYALAVAGSEVRGRELVSTLIELAPSVSSGANFEPSSPSGVQQAEYIEPIERIPGQVSDPNEPTPATSPRPVERTAYMPMVPPENSISSGTSYSGLLDKTSAVRSKYLALELHRPHDLSSQEGQSVKLSECLQGAPTEHRARVIEAYWLVCQDAAAHRALSDRVDMLAPLTRALLDQVDAAAGSPEPLGGGGLALRAAQKSAQAAARESQVKLLESQYELTLAAGRPLDAPWLMPSTSPHAGHYALRLDSQPGQLVESWAVRRLAVTIPALASALHNQADAVVNADSLQGDATGAYVADASQPIGPLLDAVNRTTNETLGYLETLTAYNQAIAEYVLTVLPSHFPGEELAATMVIE